MRIIPGSFWAVAHVRHAGGGPVQSATLILSGEVRVAVQQMHAVRPGQRTVHRIVPRNVVEPAVHVASGGAVWVGEPGHAQGRHALHPERQPASLRFHPAVLKPNFDCRLGEIQGQRQLTSARARHVVFADEFFLQPVQLVTCERGAVTARARWIILTLVICETKVGPLHPLTNQRPSPAPS